MTPSECFLLNASSSLSSIKRNYLMQPNDQKPSRDVSSAQQALRDARRLLQEGQELRRKVNERFEPVARVTEKDLRFRLR
jgi:hypothetical protein